MPSIDLPQFRRDLPAGEKKQMLSVVRDIERGVTVVKINYSSLDIIQTCMRKSYYSLHRELRSATEAPALVFGSAFHKAMDVWYRSPRSDRKQGSMFCDDSHALMLAGKPPLEHGNCARCGAIYGFLELTLGKLTDADKQRSPDNGINILNHYFDTYLDDPYEVLSDKDGPLAEREVSMLVFSGKIHGQQTEIWLFGTIDQVLINRETREIIGCDHKTTSSLGKDFFNRIRPNFQYIGYWWLIRDVLKIQISQFMVNGVQVALTKQAVHRQLTYVSDEDIHELYNAIIWNVTKQLECIDKGIWPMSTPSACCMWGGCNFKRICECPENVREAIIKAEFPA